MAENKEAPAAEAPAEEGGEEKKNGNMLMVIGIIAGIVLVQTVIVFFVLAPAMKPESEETIAARMMEDSLRIEAEKQTRAGVWTDDTPIKVTVNIAGTNAERFLKASIVLEYDEKDAKLGAELRRRSPTQYTDLIRSHLSTLSWEEMNEAGAEDKIKKDLLRRINKTLPVSRKGEEAVWGIKFTEFIMQ